MRRTSIIALIGAASAFAAGAALAAPPPVKAAPVQAPQLTSAQVGALQPIAAKPRLRLFRRPPTLAGAWHGANLIVADPPIPAVAYPAQAACTSYPPGMGLLYAWKVKNAGEQATKTPATIEVTCDIGPDGLAPSAKAEWDQRLCGCMRRTFPDRVPPLQPGLTYGDVPPGLSTAYTFISIPQVPNMPPGPVPCESPWPRAKVTVKVLPHADEGPATGDNSMTVEFCN